MISSRSRCVLRRLHTVTYQNGLAMQKTLAEARQRGEIDDQLLLLEHPPVFTLGKSRAPANLLASHDELREAGIEFHETTRGGDITYHGPRQIVGYPLLHLGQGARDVRRYVTNLEEVIIRSLAEYGIEAGRDERNRGVWIGNDKIAAIGIRIARWVTQHGFALNVDPDMSHYRFITACGVQDAGVTSIQRLLGFAPPVEEVQSKLIRHFADVFDRDIDEASHDLEIVKVVIHDGSRVLLLHRSPAAGDFWQPITGRIESGEEPLHAAAREIEEEIGLRHAVVEDLGSRQSFLIDAAWTGDRPLFADERAFTAEINPEHSVRLDPEEHDGWGWFSFDEARARLRWSDDLHAIDIVERRFASPERNPIEQA